MSGKWGALCFSKTWKEQLLWAHYADKHKGVALGFELPEREVIEVRYDPNEIREKIDLSDDTTGNENKFLKLAEKKFKEWEYEKEYRLLIRLDGCKREDGLYFIPFGNRLKVKEIVLGCKFNHKELKETISKLAFQSSANIIPTRPGWQDYRIHQCGSKTNIYRELQKKWLSMDLLK